MSDSMHVKDEDVLGAKKIAEKQSSKLRKKRSLSVANQESERALKLPKLKVNPHPVHWYSGEMVIISIQNVSFKLLRQRLEKKSEWFENRFQSVSPDGVHEEDGCRIYVVDDSGVKAEDFSVLLDVMENTIKFSQNPPFETLAQILRAATGFQFTKLRDRAIYQLELMWPRSFAKLHKPLSYPQLAEETVLLAVKCDVPILLKRAMYQKLITPMYWNDHGVLSSDSCYVTYIESLGSARNYLTRQWATMANAPHLPTHNRKNGKGPCCGDPSRQKFSKRYAEIMHKKPGVYSQYLADPIGGLQVLIDYDWAKCCQKCIERQKIEWKKRRETMWNELDQWLYMNLLRDENDED